MSQITMEDIAQKAGVSRHTVSKVINNRESYVGERTRERVLAAIKELDYRPNHFARSLKAGRTGMIGITTLNEDIAAFGQRYPSSVYSGIADFFHDRHYKMIFHNFTGADNKYPFMELARARMVDGIILLLFAKDIPVFRKEKIADRLKDLRLPYVIIHSLAEDFGALCVGLDCGEGAYRAVRHLAGHGYDTVGMVTQDQDAKQIKDMEAGYRRGLAASALTCRDDFIYAISSSDRAAGYRLAGELLASGRELPRALYVFTDDVAFGIIQKFGEAGIRVPDDIALVGFRDDNRVALELTGLTSVREPAREKGMKAGELLLEQLEHGHTADALHPVIFKPELTIRSSCGA